MLDDLGIDVPSLVAFLVNFLLLLGLLTLVLYKPVTKMLDERSAKIKEGLEQAELARAESIRAEGEVKAQIEAGRKEGQAIVAQANQVAARVQEEAREGARQEAEALITKARAEIDREREEGFNQLRKEFVDLAMLAAEKVINQSLDKQAHQKLIEETLEKGAKPE
ncbi:F0F1 ATP synthase subunit B [Chloroflexota bacterium]